MAGIEHAMVEIDRLVSQGALSDPACSGWRAGLIAGEKLRVVAHIGIPFPTANNRTRLSLCTVWQICNGSGLAARGRCGPPVLRLKRENWLERGDSSTLRCDASSCETVVQRQSRASRRCERVTLRLAQERV